MYLALAGGVGGGKLAAGLAAVLPSDDLVVAVNTGDDFEHLAMHISPDLDSVMYAVAGLENPETGWGQKDETWAFMTALERLGSETWFRLGDRDLATHVERTRRLRIGESLSLATAQLCRALSIACTIVPMSDDAVRTIVDTDVGRMDFQTYFVRKHCEPRISALSFEGADRAAASEGLLDALEDDRLQGIIICPSNPFVSIDPILAIKGVRDRIAERQVPVVAVSPIVGGKAIKGPAAKMFAELLGVDASVDALADHYGSLLAGLVIDSHDARSAVKLRDRGLRVSVTNTLMTSLERRKALAREALDLIHAAG